MVLTEKVMKAEIGGRGMVVGSWWCDGFDVEIRDFKQRLVCGGDCTGEVRRSIFQGENPRSGLNWFFLAMFLLKTLF
jgi:hypothetical protein